MNADRPLLDVGALLCGAPPPRHVVLELVARLASSDSESARRDAIALAQRYRAVIAGEAS